MLKWFVILLLIFLNLSLRRIDFDLTCSTDTPPLQRGFLLYAPLLQRGFPVYMCVCAGQHVWSVCSVCVYYVYAFATAGFSSIRICVIESQLTE